MKKLISALVISIFLMGVFFIDTAFAGKVHERQVNQHQRIGQGVKSGELTKRETAVLAHEQKHIQVLKQRSWQDGKLTQKERLRLENVQDHSSDHIYALKHNNKER
ncbi:MAG: hypothetical protein Q7U02_02245 [Desulfosalsimonadaceae bacterium]|nr:hypothetical protein [Desulfosalsimonadaceae bacterium]